MRFLGILRFGGVNTRTIGKISLAELIVNDGAGLGDRFRRNLYAVGSHIGDETRRLAVDLDAFIEALGNLHGAAGGETKLARSFLLNGRGGEGRVRVAPRGLAFHRLHGEARGSDALFDFVGKVLVRDIELLELLAVKRDEAGDKGCVPACLHVGFNGPVFAGAEGLDFEFTVADKAQRHGLDPAGRA